MPALAEVGAVLRQPGGHPVLVLTDYPASPADLVIFVNFTDSKLGSVLFSAGYVLSGGFTFTKDSTVFMEIREVTRAQADFIVSRCSHCGFAGQEDVKAVRKYVAVNIAKISSSRIRALIEALGW